MGRIESAKEMLDLYVEALKDKDNPQNKMEIENTEKFIADLLEKYQRFYNLIDNSIDNCIIISIEEFNDLVLKSTEGKVNLTTDLYDWYYESMNEEDIDEDNILLKVGFILKKNIDRILVDCKAGEVIIILK